MDPLTIAALIGAGGSIISGLLGSSAASSAAGAQSDALKEAIRYQKKVNKQTRADIAPWLKAGKAALAQYGGELGISTVGADGKPFQSQFKKTPGYDFAVAEGEKGAVNNLRALGLGGSGAALKALTRFRTGLADQTYQTYLDRLSGASVGGQTSAATSGNQQITSAAGVAGNMAGVGAAQGSGYVGGANAITGALGNFTNNLGAALGGYDQNWKRIAA